MTTSFKIKNHRKGKSIALCDPFSNTRQIVKLFAGIKITIGSLWLTYYAIQIKEKPVIRNFLLAMLLLLLFVGFRFLYSGFRIEKLFITDERLDIIRIKLFRKQKSSYFLNKISNFRYENTTPTSGHVLFTYDNSEVKIDGISRSEFEQLDYLLFGLLRSLSGFTG